MREYRDNPGSNLGRREVGGRSAGAFGGADGGLQWLWRARWRDRTRQEALADYSASGGRWRVTGRAPGWEFGSQGPAELLLPGPALGKMQGDPACRAGEPSGQGDRPARSLWSRSAHPGRSGFQRARLWAITCTASQAVGGKAARRWFSPTPYLRSRIAFSISAWRRWSASSSRVSPSRCSDEAVIAVDGEESQLRTGRRLHPPDDEPYRRGIRPLWKGV